MDVGVIHANDWWTFPLAVEAAKENKARIILDLHEYAVDEYDEALWWRILYKSAVKIHSEEILTRDKCQYYCKFDDRKTGTHQEFGFGPCGGNEHSGNPS